MNLIRRIGRQLTSLGLQWRLSLDHHLWGIEGVNRSLLLCIPEDLGSVLRRYGANLASDCTINSPLLIHNADPDYSNLTIGAQCHLGKDVFLDLRDKINIEDRVTISMRTTIITHTDVGLSPLRDSWLAKGQGPVVIKRGAYLGAAAVILQGVTVGECAVVGAGAVVTNDIPDLGVAVGVPARTIHHRSPISESSDSEPDR